MFAVASLAVQAQSHSSEEHARSTVEGRAVIILGMTGVNFEEMQ